MAHEIDFSNNRANVAFLGSRDDVWHHLGQEMAPGMDIDAWAKAAGMEWEAVKVPAIPALEGARFDHIPAEKRFLPVPDRNFIVRSDNGHTLGYCSNLYQPVQPREVLDWFKRYIEVDERFELDVAGCLKEGEIIWATAIFREPLQVAGDKHLARILMSTTFDASGATINQGTMTRTVCKNTLQASFSDKRAVIKTRHNTKFNAKRVGEELAQIAQGFTAYKAMGDALAQNEMSKQEIADFFKTCLDIPLEAKHEDTSTRKLNQFAAVTAAYKTTVAEGATGAWAALNAITRYVDHDRSTKGGDNVEAARFHSSQFGSGAQIKGQAVNLLLPRIKDKLLIAA